MLYGMRISRILGSDVMNVVSMSIGQIGFSRTLPGVTGQEPAGDRTSGAFEKVTERTFIENTREQPTVQAGLRWGRLRPATLRSASGLPSGMCSMPLRYAPGLPSGMCLTSLASLGPERRKLFDCSRLCSGVLLVQVCFMEFVVGETVIYFFCLMVCVLAELLRLDGGTSGASAIYKDSL